tara:strand:+ start:9523 stop:10095 length:573 start_codon:yes stop_codon:yes gene_type:complete
MSLSKKNHEHKMNIRKAVSKTTKVIIGVLFLSLINSISSCSEMPKQVTIVEKAETIAHSVSETPDYFLLRPEVEKAYGYSHAVKIGNSIKISGAVSMDDEGNPTAIDNFEQQMKNCYADLDKILKHYGCTFNDVVVENVFTTDMAKFLEVAGYRTEIYKTQFPTGSWLGVKELAIPEFLIEIELEVHKSN